VSIRYVRRGLRVVRVVDATPPVLEPPAPAVSLEDAAATMHRTAQAIRADARRRRGWGFGQAPKTPDPKRDLPGADLKRARKAAGLSQRELAAAWGLSRGLIGTIELGHRSCPLGLADWARRTNAAHEVGEQAQAEQVREEA
jgi:DNA-binding XRE family transcriptional regulator